VNITEASKVALLLRWVCSLTVWETTDAGRDVTDAELVDTIGALADRAHRALGAGWTRRDAESAARLMLGTGPCAICGQQIEPGEGTLCLDNDPGRAVLEHHACHDSAEARAQLAHALGPFIAALDDDAQPLGLAAIHH
jgi:hypothetical protein